MSIFAALNKSGQNNNYILQSFYSSKVSMIAYRLPDNIVNDTIFNCIQCPLDVAENTFAGIINTSFKFSYYLCLGSGN